MTDIDWSKAPADAEYGRYISGETPDFYTIICGELFFWDEDRTDWSLCTWRTEKDPDMQKRPDPQWSGDGLPPVGTLCEFQGYTAGAKRWMPATVIGIDGETVVLSYKGNYFGESAKDLRPIRTEAQIAAEEREKAYKGMVDDLSAAIGLSNIDERECDVLHALADAGYRKQEKPE